MDAWEKPTLDQLLLYFTLTTTALLIEFVVLGYFFKKYNARLSRGGKSNKTSKIRFCLKLTLNAVSGLFILYEFLSVLVTTSLFVSIGGSYRSTLGSPVIGAFIDILSVISICNLIASFCHWIALRL